MTPPPRTPVLRPARDADTAAVAAVWAQGWRDGHLGHVPDQLAAARTPESFRARAADRVGDTTVADDGGEIAGFVMVAGDEVEQVYVAARHRGTGIAATLLAEAGRRVAAGGHTRAWLMVVPGNTRARRFYTRYGWTDDGPVTHRIPHDGTTIEVPCHRYSKAVTA